MEMDKNDNFREMQIAEALFDLENATEGQLAYESLLELIDQYPLVHPLVNPNGTLIDNYSALADLQGSSELDNQTAKGVAAICTIIDIMINRSSESEAADFDYELVAESVVDYFHYSNDPSGTRQFINIVNQFFDGYLQPLTIPEDDDQTVQLIENLQMVNELTTERQVQILRDLGHWEHK